MISVEIVALTTLCYFGLLFVVAQYADRRRAQGRSLTDNVHIYSLSLAVYATSWTFYGSVGRAATNGLDFLCIYIGPTLICFTWWFLLRKMVRVSKEQNIVSIADFISSRYGKSASLGAIITLFAVLGIMPYIALQLKAVAMSFDILTSGARSEILSAWIPALPPFVDSAFFAAILMCIFSILFGTRSLDATERHSGLVMTLALEALVKIVAFVSVGAFITFGLFDGPVDIFERFAQQFPEKQDLFVLNGANTSYISWFSLTTASMLAAMFLPRQFHVMVVENSSESHIKGAMWRFPAYLFIINIFVIPIALGGLLLTGGDTSRADFFVIELPLISGYPWLALFVFIGGISAAAGMVMVSSITLSTMILNHLVMPLLLRKKLEEHDYSGLLINIKRLGVAGVIFLGYFYYRIIGESYALVNIGLTSFIAASQFAPALIGGLYWRRGNHWGATFGILLGFILWFYTLLIPSFVRSGWLASDILDKGLFGFSQLRPLELFGLTGLDLWSHSLFWTLFFNIGAYLSCSLLTGRSEVEVEQADKFIDVFQNRDQEPRLKRISKAPTVMEFVDLMRKFIGEKQAHSAIAQYLSENREIDERGSLTEFELPSLKRFTEKTLAGSVGAAPARIIIDNYLSTRGSTMEDVFDIFGSVTHSRTRSREQLGVLYEVAAAVANGNLLQTILDDTLEVLQRQFIFDLAVIRIIDKESNSLTVRSQKGMTSEHLGESERAVDMETYIGSTFLTNTATVVNDTDFMDKPRTAVVIHREGIKSFAHAPIGIEGETVGVLSAFSRSAKGIFTEEFLELFNSIASQIGIAIRNADQTRELISAREHDREMLIAKNIQLGLLPAATPELSGIELAGICVPARQVGGDYYDFLKRDDGKLDLVIADVSGHNVGAALIMAQTRTFIQAKASSLPSPSKVLQEVNSFFYEDLSRAELFITMFYLRYDVTSGHMTYASAGHNPPLLCRQNNHIDELDAEGLILGILPEVDFHEPQTQLEPGDLLLMYTDGIIEAENASGDFFGTERLKSLLIELKDQEPQLIIDNIFEQVRLFTGVRHFEDDVSLVVMSVAITNADK